MGNLYEPINGRLASLQFSRSSEVSIRSSRLGIGSQAISHCGFIAISSAAGPSSGPGMSVTSNTLPVEPVLPLFPASAMRPPKMWPMTVRLLIPARSITLGCSFGASSEMKNSALVPNLSSLPSSWISGKRVGSQYCWKRPAGSRTTTLHWFVKGTWPSCV